MSVHDFQPREDRASFWAVALLAVSSLGALAAVALLGLDLAL